MYLQPIQITDEGILIPHHYLHDARDLVIEFIDGYILLRPKPTPTGTTKNWLSDLVGIAETRDVTASEKVEEILADEIDRRAGWTFDPYQDEGTV